MESSNENFRVKEYIERNIARDQNLMESKSNLQMWSEKLIFHILISETNENLIRDKNSIHLY